jgi:hypothetical protein
MSPLFTLRPLCLALLFLLYLSNFNSYGGGLYPINTVEELKQALDSILDRLKAYPHDLYSLDTKIVLDPGFYQIKIDDPFFAKRLHNFQENGPLRASNTWIRIAVHYKKGPKAPLLYEGTLYQGLSYLQARLKQGLKLSRELTYLASSPRQFLRALRATLKNRQDTLIRIPFCSKAKCITSPAWTKQFLALKMAVPDGMRLRIKSRFCSLDQEKYQFFQNRLVPFL